MKTSKKAFGENYAEKFNIGDLVWWITWEEKEDFSIDSVTHHGALIDIIVESGTITGKEVCMAKILPYGSQKTIKINIMLIRKETS